MKRFFALVLIAFGFAGAARADYIPAIWVDTAPEATNHYIGNGQSFTYTHDITDTGYRPGTDRVDGFVLSIDLADDSSQDGSETAFIDLPNVLEIPLPWLGIDFGLGDGFVTTFGTSGSEFGGFSILGLLQLDALGAMQVTIKSLSGDFVLLGSTLTAQGRSVANVPEPGALGLLGVGLVGIALSKRRRKQAARV